MEPPRPSPQAAAARSIGGASRSPGGPVAMDGLAGTATAYDAAVAAAAAQVPTPKINKPGSARHGGAVGGMGGGGGGAGGGFGPGSLRYNGTGGSQAPSESDKQSLASITSEDMHLALFSGEDVIGVEGEGALDDLGSSAGGSDVFDSWVVPAVGGR